MFPTIRNTNQSNSGKTAASEAVGVSVEGEALHALEGLSLVQLMMSPAEGGTSWAPKLTPKVLRTITPASPNLPSI